MYMRICTSVKMALRPCDSNDSDVPSDSNSSDMSSETSDNLVFVSKEGKSSVRVYFGYEANAQQATEGKGLLLQVAVSSKFFCIDHIVIKSDNLTIFLTGSKKLIPSKTTIYR